MQVLINGIIAGSATALLAVAFQAVYLPTRVFFVGLAGIYSLAPFVAHAVLVAGGGWPLAVSSALVVSVAIATACEFANHAPLTRRGASVGGHLISSLGIYIVLVQAITMIWGNETKTLRTGLDAVTRVGDVVITGAQWIAVIAAAVLLGAFGLFLWRSDLGLRLRALADNPTQFALMGYNVDRYRLFAFGLAGLLAASAAIVSAYDFGFDPYLGLHAVLLAVVAVIIGGRGTFLGPVLGALLLGVIRASVVWHWSARWQEGVTFALLAIFLLLRPQGLLGRQQRVEAVE